MAPAFLRGNVFLLSLLLAAMCDICRSSENNRQGIIVGGLTSVKPADSAVQLVADSVRSAVTQRVQAENYAVTQFTVISYKTQVVAGVNYYIKIRINDNPKKGYVHARVFASLDGTDQLVGLETGHSYADPINVVPTFD